MEGRLGRFINRVRSGIRLPSRSAENRWGRLEKIMPRLKDGMKGVKAEFEAGGGNVFNVGITLIPVEVFMSQLSSGPTAGGERAPSSTEVWSHLDAVPGLHEGVAQGIRDIAEGRGRTVDVDQLQRREKSEQPHQE